jgi:DNA-binding MarR family transcriptional regulator
VSSTPLGDAGETFSSGAARPRTTYLIGRLDRIVRRAFDELLREFELTALPYTALTVLAARPGLSNAQLARRSFMTPQGMNQVVESLEAKGMVRRLPSPYNRRVRCIELTDRGRWVVEQCAARVEAFEQSLLDALDPDEQVQLNHLLRVIVDANRHTRPEHRSGAAHAG